MFRIFRVAALTAIAGLAFVTGAAQAQSTSVTVTHNRGGHHGGAWGAHIDLFSSTNFRGQRVRLTTSVSDLRWYGFGGRANSARVSGRWRLCSQTNFRGHCTTVSHSRSSLGGMRVQSVRFVSR